MTADASRERERQRETEAGNNEASRRTSPLCTCREREIQKEMIGGCKLKQAAKRLAKSCISIQKETEEDDDVVKNISYPDGEAPGKENDGVAVEEEGTGAIKNCAICLEPLMHRDQTIFTAQCSHAFHFLCISSNVQHGNTTCPICRAQWSRLPHQLSCKSPLQLHESDPILRILDDSIANFRDHRLSSHRSARYDDDDPIRPSPISDHPRLHLTLIPVSPPDISPCQPSHMQVVPLALLCGNSRNQSTALDSFSVVPAATCTASPSQATVCRFPSKVYLSVRLADAPAIDLVVVASSNGAQMRLVKQSMASAVSSLRPVDRLAIVSCTTAAAMRAFPLRCMTTQGKRAALQVIERLFFMGDADHTEGIQKAVKILEDRAHLNPYARVLLLSDGPVEPLSCHDVLHCPVQILQFRFGFGFSSLETCVKQEFEEFLAGLVGEVIRESWLRIEDRKGAKRVWLGDLREGEERRVPVDIGENGSISVCYNYVDSVDGLRSGEVAVRAGETGNCARQASIGMPRNSGAERWECHDPCMARRWAKHLHGLL